MIKWQDKNWKAVREGLDIWVSSPSGLKPKNLIQEDVWGKHEMESEHIPKIPIRWIHHGMIVASSDADGLPIVCPVWKDKLPYKSVTVICKPSQEQDVTYWLEYVQGTDSVSRRKKVGNKVALRSDYKCW